MDIVLIVGLFFIRQVPAFPSGAPLTACGHLMPIHENGELQTMPSPYVLILNDTTYRSQPLKLTISVAGAGARDFMAFMLQARSEFGQPAGYFSDVPQASKTMTCYEKDDTLTHTAAFIRSAMEVVWHPPPKNIGKISITGSVAVSKIKYWAVESNALRSTGPLDTSGAPQAQQPVSSGNGTSSGGDGYTGTGRSNSAEALATWRMQGLICILMFLCMKLINM
ncbi:hypothetical protein BsWGS_05031 [Bradybaena similaris]